MDKNCYDILIIGGGASGLACAVQLLRKRKNLKICIVDAGERLGRKLAATGNGQGNLSNTDMTARHFHGGNTELVEKIACSDPYAGTKLFSCLFSADEKGRIYPSGRQASALADNLISATKSLGISSCITGERADAIIPCGGGCNVRFGGNQAHAKFVVLCTGGKAQKQFKTDGSAYNLATALGHTVTPLFPSLVQIKTDTKYIKTLKGIRADCVVSAYCGGEKLTESRGDVIFTDYGVSGNAVFSVSSHIADKPDAQLSIEFLPDFSVKEIQSVIECRLKSGCDSAELLSGSLHNQIGRAIIKRAGNADVARIVNLLKNFTLPITGTLGFDYAQVTKGGINMSEISDGLESKIVDNLFFAGEILDVDGDCGGYNLQWAFTSGIRAADSILERVN